MLSGVIETFCGRTSRDASVPGIDGLRCYAALLVILAHSHLVAPGWGATGVFLFFVLSGMLLTPSLVKAYKSPVIPREVFAYLVRRIFRIMPAFIFVAAVFCAVIWVPKASVFNYKLFWQLVTFKYALWHFWTTKIEMLLYLALPVVVGALVFLRGWRLALGLAIVVAGTYLATEYWKLIVLVVSPKAEMPFRVTPFFLGMAIAFVSPTISEGTRKVCFWVGVVGLAALSADTPPLLAMRQAIGLNGITLPWDWSGLIYPFAALTVFGAVGDKSLLLNNRVVQTIGVVGFSVYLWQSFVLYLLRKYGLEDPSLLFLAALPLILLLSVLTYNFIELPGQRLGSKISRKIVRRGPSVQTIGASKPPLAAGSIVGS
ncbi:acyltransferase [Microvirga sp. BT689]|uniref:acyltransferase family protein n=1 Tax=Microvirga arvi TaxID=2778731 RepID=UPI00194F93AF|nr:acyltransferase [Microvirga arvi]MBM6580982.1 acyltransferase [Microvirga arvi]